MFATVNEDELVYVQKNLSRNGVSLVFPAL